MSDLHGTNKDRLDIELNSKLKELSLLKSPSRKTATYLGDEEDHHMRESVRSAMSPSPRQDERHRAEQKTEALADLSASYKNILRDIGEDPTRQGLLRTPERAAKALLYFTKGYDEKIGGELFVYAQKSVIYYQVDISFRFLFLWFKVLKTKEIHFLWFKVLKTKEIHLS